MKKLVGNLLIGLLVCGLYSCDDSDDANSSDNNAGSVDEYTEIAALITSLDDLNLEEVDEGSEGGINGRLKATQECITFAINREDDGTLVYTYDFGDGCEVEEGVLTGKVTVTISAHEENGFEQSTVYESLSIDDWSIDGEAVVSSSTSSEDDPDLFNINRRDVTNLDLTIIACDGQTFDVISTSTAEISLSGLVVSGLVVSGLVQTITAGALVYETTLEKPLVIDFSCLPESVYTYTEGILKTSFDDSEYVLDYGDGTCDNLVLETIDGETTEVEASGLEERDLCS